ncbi:hypothetical protein [Ferrovibrio xuzhouensis]|uniref:DUF1440 domain-containing protein n=1 Tax=Ferrovibrio xuzhouensis TaxID=1576914 RepID=A0ABV7VGQ4_9PROT
MTGPVALWCRLGAGLLAGAIAIGLNTVALKLADYVPLATAHGGLLRLVSLWIGPVLQQTGIAALWLALGGPPANTPPFQTGFHLAVGLAMAVVYVVAIEPVLPRPAWLKGAIYAAGVWLLNAVVVLPLTGEGFAGSAHLTPAGMLWYAAAHTLFFMTLALLFARFSPRPPRPISRGGAGEVFTG